MPTAVQISGVLARTYNWIQPCAVTQGTDTYFSGVIDTNGDWRVYRSDVNGTVTYQKLYDATEQDDHNAPALAIQPGKDMIAFFARHGQSAYLNYCTSPLGALNFGAKSSLTFSRGSTTYCQPIFKGNDLYVFVRNSSEYWSFKHSPDWAATWDSGETDFIYGGTGNKIYIVLKQDESNTDLYHCAAYGHPSESSLRDIWYCTLNISTGDIATPAQGTIANMDGTNLPLNITSLDTAWLHTGTYQSRLHDVAIKQGKPCILRAQWSDGSPIPLYKMTYLNSGTWNHVTVETSGGEFFNSGRKYVGGMSFDKAGQNRFYLSKKDTADNNIWKVRTWLINSDMTVTYSSTRDTSSQILARPIPVQNGNGVVYCQFSDYTSFTNFNAAMWWKQE